MQVSNVTQDDGIQCATVMRALSKATFNNVSQKDMEALRIASRWITDLAKLMAEQLSRGSHSKVEANQEAASETPMRIKAMGPIGGKPTKKKK